MDGGGGAAVAAAPDGPAGQDQAQQAQDQLAQDNADGAAPDQVPAPPPNPLGNPDLLGSVIKFLSYKDLQNCRQTSSLWNKFVLKSERFRNKSKGKITEKWYKTIANMDLTNTFRWEELQLTHFQYHRHSVIFKNYWHFAVSTTLAKLTLCKCAFECDGFIFLLSHCSNLETLVLNGCKLRDLDDLHTIPGRGRIGAPCSHAPLPIQKPLQHISIENMWKLEQCFMDYLIQRINGHLQSLKIVRCFDATQVDQAAFAKANRPSLDTMYQEFERNILRILRENRDNLVKLSFEQNCYQMHFFHALSQDENNDLLQVPELKIVLTVAEPQNGYVPFIQFMAKPHPHVRKLHLQVMGYITSETFHQAIHSFKPTLEEFTFVFAGDKLCVTDPLDIAPVRDFTRLQRLIMRDSKVLCERDVRAGVGGRRIKRRIDHIHLRLSSNLNCSVFTNFPPAEHLREVSFEQCVFRADNFGLTLPMVEGPNGQQRSLLTKLQLRGPVLQGVQGILGPLIQHFPLLETLALTYCTLGDADLTGLDPRAVFDIRRCLTVGLAIINAGPNPTAEQVIRGVESSLVYRGVENRPKISSLQHLQHLDLSGNIEISDLSLFEALRMPNLKTLELQSNNNISDTGMEFVRLFCPNLKEINLKNCRRLSKYGLNRLIQGCKNLRRIFTTQMIVERTLADFRYDIAPNFNDIVVVSAASAQASAFTRPDDDFRPFSFS